MALNPAGHTQQTSKGFGLTLDESHVRHEKSRAQQTTEMISEPYNPLKKTPPVSTEAWQARLFAYPQHVHEDLDAMHETLTKIQMDSAETRKHRSAGSTMRRLAAEVVSAPDAGNLKANRATAIRLSDAPGPKKLTKPAPFRTEPQREGYHSLNPHLALLAANDRQKRTTNMMKETSELIDIFKDALKKSDALRKAGGLERSQLLNEIATGQTTAEKELASADTRIGELEEQIDLLKRRIDVAKRTEKPSDSLSRELKKVENSLAKTLVTRDIALGLQAPQEAPKLIKKAEVLREVLEAVNKQNAADTAAATDALKQVQKEEIDASLDALRGLEGRKDKTEVRQFIRDALKAVHDKPLSATAHEIPAPLITDIFIDALAQTAGPTTPLNEALKNKTLDLIRSLSGGLLAYEQITGKQLKDKNQRIAHRVEAMAMNTLEQVLKANEEYDVDDEARVIVLKQAIVAARAIRTKGDYNACTEVQRASYGAIRNEFFAQLDPDDTDIDQRLVYAGNRFEKSVSTWVSLGADKDWKKNPMLSKTPFSGNVLELAAKTSTLGYDVPARPMARLDKNLREAAQRLESMIPEETMDEIGDHAIARDAARNLVGSVGSIAAHSLNVQQVMQLATLIVASNKARLDVNNPRPGHVKLDNDDIPDVQKLIDKKLGQLLMDDAAPLTTAVIKEFISAHGDDVARPNELVRLVDDIKDHILDEKADGTPNKLKEDLLKNTHVVRNMIATEEVKQISTRADLYAYLAPKMEQFELRGKLKTLAGGNVGASTKALTWPLSLDPGTISLVVPVRGNVSANEVRCAVFEIGFSTTGIEFFVGSETRKTKAIGAGAGPRLGWEVAVSSGAGVDKTFTFERSNTEGVWARLPRDGNDDLTRQQGLAVLKTMLGIEGTDADLGPDPRIGQPMVDAAGVKLMPKIMGDLLGNHSNLSVSVVDTYQEDTYRNETTPSGSVLTVAGGSGDDASRIQILSASEKLERRSKRYKQRDATGFMKITRSNAASGGTASGQAGVVAVSGLFAINADDSENTGFGGLLNATRQHAEKYLDVKLRYITRDGETNAVDTRTDYENANFENHMKRINEDPSAWIELGKEQLFKPDPKKPEANQGIVEHQKTRLAKKWFNDVLNEAKEKSEGNSRHVYSLSYAMKSPSAAIIDGVNCKADLARLANKPRQAEHMEKSRDVVMQNTAAWTQWKSTTSERTSESRQFGWSLGLTYANFQRTEGQRGTSSYPA